MNVHFVINVDLIALSNIMSLTHANVIKAECSPALHFYLKNNMLTLKIK